jgi:hypothetical protein
VCASANPIGLAYPSGEDAIKIIQAGYPELMDE